jgi:hypothetical protein
MQDRHDHEAKSGHAGAGSSEDPWGERLLNKGQDLAEVLRQP